MGTERREKIFILAEDAERLGMDDGAKVKVRSDTGEMNGIIQLASVKSGTLQAHWPEANDLISRRTDPVSREPDCSAKVWIAKI